jgi:hypothetical protein
LEPTKAQELRLPLAGLGKTPTELEQALLLRNVHKLSSDSPAASG